MTPLGICADGRSLVYDERLFEFRLDRVVTPFAQVRELDDHGHIHWRALEQRDWFRKIDPAQLEARNKAALTENEGEAFAGMTPEERVQADAARDDSIIAGKVVEADPSLVQAVANALEKEGLIGKGAPGQPRGGVQNPLATADLPEGMEPLSQMMRAQGDRKMTHTEKRLMQKILKNNDRAKVKREKAAEEDEAAAKRQKAKNDKEKECEQERPGASSQRKVSSQQSQRAKEATRLSEENERAQKPLQAEQVPVPIEYYDTQGNLIAVANVATAESDSGDSDVSAEEQALIDMRKRNQQIAQKMQSNDVPGMKESRRHRLFGG